MIKISDKKDCCGCGACMNACPKSAIKMCEDKHGFVYPVIDDDLCVGCGVCETRCPFGVAIRENIQKAVRVFGY